MKVIHFLNHQKGRRSSMALKKLSLIISSCICSYLVSSSTLANEVVGFNSTYDHFAPTIKQADTTKPLRLLEDANKKVRTLKNKAKYSMMRVASKSSAQSANECTVDNLYTLSGDSLVNFIKGCVHENIVQSPLFEINDKTEQIFSEANMLTLASSIETISSSDDHSGLASLMLLARAGHYVDFYSDNVTLSDDVMAAYAGANKAFADSESFLNTDDANMAAVDEWTGLVDGAEDWVANFDALMSIVDIYPFQTVDTMTYMGNKVIYSVQYSIWRAQNADQEFYDLINNDSESVTRFTRFVNDLYPFMGTDNEGAFINSISDLARLLGYSNHQEATRTVINGLLEDWERMSTEWVKLAFAINDYDDCTQYTNMCAEDLRTEMMVVAFPNTFTFDDGNLVINTAISMDKAQALYHAQKQVEAQFKRKNQELDALASDENEALTMYVYGTRSDYEQFHPYLFGLDTENGGIYIESWGQFFTYERTSDESIYSLEELFRHEYVHYLHGRYTVEGSWGETEMYQNSRLTWFEEGGAEFFAGSTQANDVELRKIMIENIEWDNGDHMSISEIVNASYSTGFKFYRYSALFFNFLNETQEQTITDLHKIVRSDDVAGFDAVVAEFANDAQLQADFSEYLTTKIGEIDGMTDFTPTAFPMPAHLDTDLVGDIQTDIITSDVFASATCETVATTVNARFGCTGTVTGATGAELNTKIDAGIITLNEGLNNFTTMNCSIGNVTIDGDIMSAPYSCEGGLREFGTDPIVNQTPTAEAGDDQNDVAIRQTISISGAASTDPEGDALTYSWLQTEGEAIHVVGGGLDEMTFNFYAYEENYGETFTFELTVFDGKNYDTDTVSVTVETEPVDPNTAPTADAGDDQTVDEGDTVTLDASGSTDPEGDELTINWTQTSGATVTITDGSFTAPDVTSTETLTFKVTVSDGEFTDTDTVTITVNNVADTTTGGNTTPTASKESSGGGSFGVFGLMLCFLVTLRRNYLKD